MDEPPRRTGAQHPGVAARSLLVLGGARSGKSRYALAHARRLPAPRVFIATGESRDAEMAVRIDAHRVERGDAFTTVEEPRALAAALGRISPTTGVVVVDCVTLWIANLLETAASDADVERDVDGVAARLADAAVPLVVISNEVGAGIVPFDAAVRRYRDLLGLANQRLADAAEMVVLMVAGQPLIVKASR